MSSQFLKPIFTNTAMPKRPTHNYAARGRNGEVFRHSQFLYDMGSASVTVKNAGYTVLPDGRVCRHPILIFCDPLRSGNGYDGLMPTGGPTYDCAEMMTRFADKKQYLMAIVHDAHVGEDQINLDALTDVCITVDYYVQMTASEQKRADRYFMEKMEIPDETTRADQKRVAQKSTVLTVEKLIGDRWIRYEKDSVAMPAAGQEAVVLTVQQLILLHGESPDSEFREFLFNFKHAIEPTETGGKALYKWVPFVRDIFERSIRANLDARRQGITAPEVRILSFHKNDLRPGVPNGLRGTGGNLVEEFFLASQYGLPQGPEHDAERKIKIFGMGTPYTVNFGIENALALGFKVSVQMDATFNFDECGISMLEQVRYFRHMYPNAFEAVIGWDKEWMLGDEPVAADGRTYNQVAREAKAALEESYRLSGGAGLNMQFYPFDDPTTLTSVIKDLT
jgi:hypothetical protein